MGYANVAAVAFLAMTAAAFAADVAVDLNHPTQWHPSYTSKEQWQSRAADLRHQVLVAAGLWPMPEKSDLHPVIHTPIDRDTYTVEHVFFESLPGFYVTGNLYRPKGPGPHPAVLSPYGHWPDGRFNQDKDPQKKIAGGGERTIEGATYPLQARCATLARMGCVVFHYDMIGYADSLQIPQHREGFTDPDSLLRLQSTLGLQLWDSIRALDFLASLPDVDPKRVAVTGASGGATQTLLLSVVDDRPAAVFPAVMISENMQGGCVCENAPYLRISTNNAELAACLAPRPLGMSAANDWTHDLETRGYPEIRSVYKLFDAEDVVTAKHFPFEHNYNLLAREMMYDFMNRHLRLGLDSPAREKPFIPIVPKDLSVWDANHPKPTTDGVKIVKEWWTHQRSPSAEETRLALRVILGLPATAAPTTASGSPIQVIAVPMDQAGAGDVTDVGRVVRVGMPDAAPAPDPKYAGLTFGYNRPLLAERARRLAVALEEAQTRSKSVSLVAHGEYAAAGHLARAAVGGVGQADIDPRPVDLATVRDPADANFLPGALRYGGFAGLSATIPAP